jgi:hypothetical protein
MNLKLLLLHKIEGHIKTFRTQAMVRTYVGKQKLLSEYFCFEDSICSSTMCHVFSSSSSVSSPCLDKPQFNIFESPTITITSSTNNHPTKVDEEEEDEISNTNSPASPKVGEEEKLSNNPNNRHSSTKHNNPPKVDEDDEISIPNRPSSTNNLPKVDEEIEISNPIRPSSTNKLSKVDESSSAVEMISNRYQTGRK